MLSMNDSAQAIALGLATLASEDLALVAAAILIQEGKLGLWPGVAGVGGGILAGDVALWLVGRVLADRILRTPFLAGRISAADLAAAKEALERRLAVAVLTSRFLPGSRLPLHLAAGALGSGGLRYAIWTTVAVAVWVPLVVGVVMLTSGRAASLLGPWFGSAWVATLGAGLGVLAVLRLARPPSATAGSAR